MRDFPFVGINLAITTPFDENGNPDYRRLELLIEQYLAAGIRGFVLSSGTGMHVYLSQEESKALIAFGAKVINGRHASSPRPLRCSSTMSWSARATRRTVALMLR